LLYNTGMISRLTGQIVHFDTKYVVLDVHGVGYKVFVTAIPATTSHPVTFWTYMAVRENAMDLYGFPSLSELNFFELLITVSGIGPKTAMGIMTATTVRTLQTAIQTGDTSHLTKTSGIGKKNAEKIVLELKDKIELTALTPEYEATMRGESDALEALRSLGYREAESREALKKIEKNIVDTSAKVKAALKLLSKS